jgi:hypothetical protein
VVTKSTGVGRGGKRAGAGPKPKPRAPTVVEGVVPPIEAEIVGQPDAVAMARQHAALAIEVLVGVAAQGASEAARVMAAKALLDLGFGKTGEPMKPPKPPSTKPTSSMQPPVVTPVDEWEGLLN